MLQQLVSNSKDDLSLATDIFYALGILVHSVHSDEFLFYLLSHDCFNALILSPAVFSETSSQGDFLPTYVSYLKTVALVLDQTNIVLVTDATNRTIPIYSRSLELLRLYGNALDSMLKSNLRTVILHVLSISEQCCRSICELESNVYELCTLCIQNFNDAYFQMAHHWRIKSEVGDVDDDFQLEISSILHRFEGDLLFFHDVHEIGIAPIQHQLLLLFLNDFLYVTLYDPLLQIKSSPLLSLSIMILTSILKSLPYPYLISIIINSLLSPIARSDRKHVLAAYFRIAEISGDYPMHSNPYAQRFLDIRAHRLEEYLFSQTSFMLFFMKVAFYSIIKENLNHDMTLIHGLIIMLSSLDLIPFSKAFFENLGVQLPPRSEAFILGEPDLLQPEMSRVSAYLRNFIDERRDIAKLSIFDTISCELQNIPKHPLSLQLSILTLFVDFEAAEQLLGYLTSSGESCDGINTQLCEYLKSLRDLIISFFKSVHKKIKCFLSSCLLNQAFAFVEILANEYRSFINMGGLDGLSSAFKLSSTINSLLASLRSKEDEVLSHIKGFLIVDYFFSNIPRISFDRNASAKTFGQLFARMEVGSSIDIREKVSCEVCFDEAEDDSFLLVLDPNELILTTVQHIHERDSDDENLEDMRNLRTVLFSSLIVHAVFVAHEDCCVSLQLNFLSDSDIIFFKEVVEAGEVINNGDTNSISLDMNFELEEDAETALNFLNDRKSEIFRQLTRVFDQSMEIGDSLED